MSGKPGAVTLGPFKADGSGIRCLVRDENSRIVAIRHREHAERNEWLMNFFADSLNVHHETGKTPRELSAALSRVTEGRDALAAEVGRLNMLLDHYRSMIA